MPAEKPPPTVAPIEPIFSALVCPTKAQGRSQLIVYHFMFDPSWEAACLHCSFWADNFNRIIVHLNQRDVTMIAVSLAPYSKLAEYRKRMGWDFKWVSSYETDFNFGRVSQERSLLQLRYSRPAQFGAGRSQRIL